MTFSDFLLIVFIILMLPAISTIFLFIVATLLYGALVVFTAGIALMPAMLVAGITMALLTHAWGPEHKNLIDIITALSLFPGLWCSYKLVQCWQNEVPDET